MTPLYIPHQAWLLVGDGRKALFLRNEGTPDQVKLATVNVLKHENPPTVAQGVDEPGRTFSSHGQGGRSSYESTDWHDVAEHAFAREVVAALERLKAEGALQKLIVVAPPRTLADIRGGLSPALAQCVIAEVDKDLTKHPVTQITQLLAGKAA